MIPYMEDKLKPCPLCGSKDIFISEPDSDNIAYTIKIRCNACGLNSFKSFKKNIALKAVKQKIIDYWNTRPYTRGYKHIYEVSEVEGLMEERGITEAQAKYIIYQREYQKKYRQDNRERLVAYSKKYQFENKLRISQRNHEKYLRRKKENGISS